MAQFSFTNRNGGISQGSFASLNLATHVGDDPKAVAANREIFAANLGISQAAIFYMNQVHGAEVAVIEAETHSSYLPEADALFTMVPGRALVTLVADCVPVLLHSKRAVSAVHIGRRGLVAGTLEASLNLFNRNEIANSEISAEIGPSICGDCYQVDLETYREVVAQHPDAATTESRRCLDISKALVAQLEKYGIDYRISNECTMHSADLFSYRRDGVTGRQAGVIWL